jgi:hypothetical protein
MSDPVDAAEPHLDAERQPYEKPAIAWQDELGARPGLIAACNKTAPLVGTCETGSLQS